jgi:hypothetical protein
MAPDGVKVYNPCFDVTDDNDLIAGIVTEYGIARPPYSKSLREIFEKKREALEAKKIMAIRKERTSTRSFVLMREPFCYRERRCC